MNNHCSVEMLADSINAIGGARLVTFLVCCPRRIYADLLSFRGLTVSACLNSIGAVAQVRDNPVTPDWSLYTELTPGSLDNVKDLWLTTSQDAWETCDALVEDGTSEQHAQQLLAPFEKMNVVISATEWVEFFDRATCSPDPALQEVAWQIADLYYQHISPINRRPDSWHAPLMPVTAVEIDAINAYLEETPFTEAAPQQLPHVGPALEIALRWAAARLMHVTVYLENDLSINIRKALQFPLESALVAYLHASPNELSHVAQATRKKDYRDSNLVGWNTFEKLLSLEPVTFDYQARRLAREAPVRGA